MISIQLAGPADAKLDDIAKIIKEALIEKGYQGEVHYADLGSKAEWDKLKKFFADRGDTFFITKREAR